MLLYHLRFSADIRFLLLTDLDKVTLKNAPFISVFDVPKEGNSLNVHKPSIF